jgi:molecular chaperone HscB
LARHGAPNRSFPVPSRGLKNHFELFGLTPAYALDLVHLDRAYRDIQANIHPDRFAHAGDAERRASMQWTTQVNEAYRTLKSPLQRAKYLLELNGVDVGFETNTAMPPEFLIEQMELREKLDDTRDADSLGLLEKDLLNQKRTIEAQIAECIDGRHDCNSASDLVRKLMFLEKLGEEIAAAYESLET